MSILELRNVNKIYNYKKENEFQALYDVNISVEEGEMIAIMGRSGAGKSTLMHIIGFIDNFESGEYFLDGERVEKFSEARCAGIRNSMFGIVMQDFALIENFTVLDNVILPLDFAKKKTNKKGRAFDVLKLVGIEEQKNKYVSKLSGGQKQRVAIARAMINNPKLILADEPTGALDSSTSEDIMNIFTKLKEMGKTIIIITHDTKVADYCDRIIEIQDGRIAEGI